MRIRGGKKFWCILILTNILIVAAVMYIYGDNDYSVAQKKNARTIGATYMTMNNEFYEIISEEINARVEAEGDKLILRNPALDADRQAEQIADMLNEGIEVLVVTPVDSGSLDEVLTRAKEMGVYIVVVDTALENDELADCTITSDNYHAGEIVGEYFLSSHETSNVLLMTHETTKSGVDRVQGFIDTVQGHYGIDIAGSIECLGQTEIAMPRLINAIDEGAEFDSIFCLNDLASVGAVAALEEEGIFGIEVYGVDGSPDSKGLIKEGLMAATAAQFPTQIGSKAADVIYELLAGETVDKEILIPVELITRDNVEEFGTDRWQ